MTVPLRALLMALSVSLIGTSAQAETYGAYGHLQHRFERLSDFVVDGQGTQHAQPYRHTMRARVGGKIAFSRDFWITSTVQLLDGQVLGAESPIPGGPRSEGWENAVLAERVQLRESTLQVPFGIGTLRVGRMPMHWGMGLVMHDGEEVDTPFDDARGGDIVNGIAINLTPMLLFGPSRMAYAAHITLGGDIVEEDEQTRRIDGDLAWRIWGSVTWKEPWLTGGIYVASRHLERDTLETRQDTVLDTSWQYRHPIGEDLMLAVEGEFAFITGHHAKAPIPGGIDERTQIMQLGAAARLSLEDTTLGSMYALEVGYASGDGDPDDDADTAFHFDPARRVGMIVFDEVLSRMSARAYHRARLSTSDAPDPSNGAISNALYIAPTLAWSALDGVFDLHAGGVIALAPSPLNTPAGDDVTQTSDSTSAAGVLGYELNTAARVVVELGELMTFSLGTQYGFFVASSKLDAMTGAHSLGLVHKWRLLADVSW